jgi:hypothetical protein
MGTIRYVLRTDKLLKTGKAPVDLIYQISGQRRFYRTGIKLYPESWNGKSQKAIYLDRNQAKKILPALDYDLLPTHKEVEEMNDTMNNLSTSISDIEKRFQLDNIPYFSDLVLEKLKTAKKNLKVKEDPANVLFDFMQKYIDDHKVTREAGSLTVYKSLKNHLQNYCRTTGRKVTFKNIDYSFFQSFQQYLLQDKRDENGKAVTGLNNTTVAKQLSTVKTFLNYARKQGIEVSNKYKDFKIKRESLEVIALTNDEFETLYNLDLSNNKGLAETRDVFCFACTTGLRYSDLSQLKREHIKSDEIKLTVKKTKEYLSIPLTPFSKAILARYQENLDRYR